ncbi:MAG: 6-bladed beta-propeller, partial [Muribaculaceae bacterium]|nr:6-bladed beta-propeller [Muribaculaceae bacterium]
MKKLIYVWLALLALVSCTNSGQGDVVADCKIITGYDNPIKPNAEGLDVEIARTIKLETTEDNLLSGLAKVVIVQDSIIILTDQNSVQSYSFDGHFRCKYGSKGNGAGDYVNMSGFYVNDDDEVVIIDNFRGALLRYDLNGNFIGKIDVEKPILNVVCGGMAVDKTKVLFNEYITENGNSLFALYDINDGKVIDELNSPLRTGGVREGIGKNPMCRYKDEFHVLMPLSQYILNSYGDSVYKFEAEKEVLTAEQLGEIKDYGFMTFAQLYYKGDFVGFTDIYETSTHIFCMTSNIEYAIVDKSALTCQVYNYTSDRKIPED